MKMIMMKRMPTALLVLTSLLLTACAGPTAIRPSGPLIERSYPLPPLSRVSFYHVGDVRVVSADESMLVVSASQNVQDVLDIDINDQRLKVGPFRGYHLTRAARPSYTLYINELERLDLSGSMSVQADRLVVQALTLAASGSVKGDLQVVAETLHVSGSGSINLTLTGQVEQLEVHGSGSIKLNSQDLLARRVEVRSSGSSNISVWAEDSLDIHTSGSTRVRYRGQPRVSQSVSGSSSIEALDD